MARHRLTPQERRDLDAELRKRWELIKQLSQLELKVLASRFNVPYHVVWRRDRTMVVQSFAQNGLQTFGK